MHELTPETITEAVLEQMATTSDPRLKEIMTAAVKHLHAFARDVNLTPAEWLKGIEFMTAVGKMCTAERQEFILLSDTLGLSALVNGLHDRTAVEDATQTSLLGPFFRENAPKLEAGAQIANKVTPGTEVALVGQGHQCARRAAAERPGVGLADRCGRSLRHPGRCQRHGLSRRLHRGCARQLPDPHRASARLLDPHGRPGRRAGAGARPAWHAAGPHPLPGQRARLPRARHRALRQRRRAHCRRRGVRLVFGSRVPSCGRTTRLVP